MDCIEGMHEMETGSVDVIVTSPPYNLGIKYNVHNDKMNSWDYLGWISNVMLACTRVLKDDGSIFLNVGASPTKPLFPFSVVNCIARRSLKVQNVIHWIKSISIDDITYGHYKPVNSERFHHSGHEYVFHLTKSGDVKLNKESSGVPYQDKSNIARWGKEKDKRDRGNVWFVPYETKQKKDEHPSMFPVRLAELCILDHGVGGLVLDPFAGAGSSMVAAKRLGCQFIGFDIDPAYVEIANQRIHNV